ncbi:MAG TPA: hypothetical protein VJJ01_02290 [Nitrosopumilaceae archaeon]|nr:hypothetical protein [Nitrosopumilaceae archaeon]
MYFIVSENIYGKESVLTIKTDADLWNHYNDKYPTRKKKTRKEILTIHERNCHFNV